MKIYYINNNLFDVFFGDGFTTMLRVRRTKAGFALLSRKGKLPMNYLSMLELKLLIEGK